MCGRFTIRYTWAEYYDALTLIPASAKGRNDPPRYNVAPTQEVGFLCMDNGDAVIKDGRWWLVPHWAKELTSKWPMFNARSEEAHKKPAFRDSMKSKRCLIPADGYYEWTKNEEDGKKDPHFLHLPDDEPFAFAGLWATNMNIEPTVTSCTILTAAAVPEISHLHHRMPIILAADAYEAWLDPNISVDLARELLTNHRDAELVSHRVGREVGSSKASGAQLIKPS
ncbi:MAG: SOS response-associated peptidase [Stappiaceae bacterium]